MCYLPSWTQDCAAAHLDISPAPRLALRNTKRPPATLSTHSQGQAVSTRWPGAGAKQALHCPWPCPPAAGGGGLIALRAGLGVSVPCGGERRWASGRGAASNKLELIPLLMLIFFFHHGPDIQLGKLQLVIRPPPALSSHANRPGHTQRHRPCPRRGLRRDGGTGTLC